VSCAAQRTQYVTAAGNIAELCVVQEAVPVYVALAGRAVGWRVVAGSTWAGGGVQGCATANGSWRCAKQVCVGARRRQVVVRLSRPTSRRRVCWCVSGFKLCSERDRHKDMEVG